jgi:hypothetical protein
MDCANLTKNEKKRIDFCGEGIKKSVKARCVEKYTL